MMAVNLAAMALNEACFSCHLELSKPATIWSGVRGWSRWVWGEVDGGEGSSGGGRERTTAGGGGRRWRAPRQHVGRGKRRGRGWRRPAPGSSRPRASSAGESRRPPPPHPSPPFPTSAQLSKPSVSTAAIADSTSMPTASDTSAPSSSAAAAADPEPALPDGPDLELLRSVDPPLADPLRCVEEVVLPPSSAAPPLEPALAALAAAESTRLDLSACAAGAALASSPLRTAVRRSAVRLPWALFSRT